ncbi:MAG: transposase [Halioglobus sp.]|nr:transposase [Halioglobus sp.]
MPRPRKAQVCVSDTPYYHCVSRCVRRARLCGQDVQTGQCFEHRRAWIVERIHRLASLFAIDICAYAVMSNHYHLVIKLGSTRDWTDDEVIARWLQLYKGPLLIHRYREAGTLSPAERDTVIDIVAVWRKRLQDLSWLMKCLNEPIARMANREDQCTGHFWEARFKSQALRSQQALLSCMAYVDLNPVRAGIAQTPESSDYTSIQQRIGGQSRGQRPTAVDVAHCKKTLKPTLSKSLLAFAGETTAVEHSAIPFAYEDYLDLVDWTSRQVRNDKRGAIAADLPPLLSRMAIPVTQWLVNSSRFEEVFHRRFRLSA